MEDTARDSNPDDDEDARYDNAEIIDISNVRETTASSRTVEENHDVPSLMRESNLDRSEFFDLPVVDFLDNGEEAPVGETDTSNNAISPKGGRQNESEATRKRRRYSCPKCDYSASKSTLLNKHIEYNHGEIFSCAQCDFTTCSSGLLYKHRAMYHAKNDRRRLHCTKCDYSVTRRNLLTNHIKNNHGETLNCDRCSFVTESSESLISHNRKYHSGIRGKRLYCTKCNYSVTSQSLLTNHIKINHRDKDMLKCEICFEQFEFPDLLKEHIDRVHPNGRKRRRHICPKCDYSVGISIVLDKHIKNNHGNIFSCDQCEFNTYSAKILSKHTVFNHIIAEKNPMRCEICYKKFQLRESLRIHIESAHPNATLMQSSFFCAHCPYSSDNKENVANHISVLHSKSMNVADVSQKAVFTPREKIPVTIQTDREDDRDDAHFWTSYKPKNGSTPGDAERLINSDISNEPSRSGCPENEPGNKENIGRHLPAAPVVGRSDEGYQDGQLICPKCDYAATRSNILNRHVKTTHGDIYKCVQCDFCTYSTGLLKKHYVVYHSMKKLYSCYHCEHKTTRLFSLRKHIISTHSSTEEDPLRCEVCRRKFRLRVSLRKHIENFHPDASLKQRPKFDCPHCPYWSDIKDNVLSHVSVFHSGSWHLPYVGVKRVSTSREELPTKIRDVGRFETSFATKTRSVLSNGEQQRTNSRMSDGFETESETLPRASSTNQQTENRQNNRNNESAETHGVDPFHSIFLSFVGRFSEI